ncbi:hypothetical protein BHE74_00019648 [Ensete ventricosum]|uniref:Uncharacterized protein n=1 Tax=Ensete ventricosum TaxID=4639 RepID=A0A445MJE2_ENSVE|nr:hypothetical protein BHE74_00019648 [Ensete ventricosum]RZR74380.1 hypothetical protein BHM03_00035981 [Ensete ventricosum]
MPETTRRQLPQTCQTKLESIWVGMVDPRLGQRRFPHTHIHSSHDSDVYQMPAQFFSTPFTCCRNGCFISVGGKLVRTPGLTSVVPRGMAESYEGRATAVVGDEGVACHTTLMGHGGARQCHTRSSPPRMLDQLPTWSLRLTWLPPGCCRD